MSQYADISIIFPILFRLFSIYFSQHLKKTKELSHESEQIIFRVNKVRTICWVNPPSCQFFDSTLISILVSRVGSIRQYQFCRAKFIP